MTRENKDPRACLNLQSPNLYAPLTESNVQARPGRADGVNLTVAADGSGGFLSVGEALAYLDRLPQGPARIYIKKGVYKERLRVRRPFLVMEGEDPEHTVITWNYGAWTPMEDNTKRGTFRTYTALIDTHDFTAINLTFVNSAGTGDKVGQALALYVDGDRIFFDRCRILACQDTLFTGPLPPVEIIKGGFVGPKQYAPRINGRHYYKDCLIRGDVDFIFGSATAYFENCQLDSREMPGGRKGYVTAASTPEGQAYGYVFESCRFTGDCAPESVYLGRPWRNFAKTVLLNCYLGAHIFRQGWHDWEKKEAHDTVFYGEYNSYGPGARGQDRPSWVILLSEDQAREYTRDKVLSRGDGWTPGELI